MPDYTPDDLLMLWEDIVDQYESVSKDNTYSSQKEEMIESALEINRINRLTAIYQLMLMGNSNSIAELSEMGIDIDKINYDSIFEVKRIIELEKTNLEVYLLRHAPSDEKKGKFEFLRSLQQLSNLFQRNIPVDISLAEWCYLLQEARKIKKVK